MLFHPEHLPLAVHRVNTLSVKGIAQLSLLSTTMNRAPGSPRVLSPYARMLTQCVEDPSLPISWTIAIIALFAKNTSAKASAVSLIPSLHVPHLILQSLQIPAITECIRDLVHAGAHRVPCDTCTQKNHAPALDQGVSSNVNTLLIHLC